MPAPRFVHGPGRGQCRESGPGAERNAEGGQDAAVGVGVGSRRGRKSPRVYQGQTVQGSPDQARTETALDTGRYPDPGALGAGEGCPQQRGNGMPGHLQPQRLDVSGTIRSNRVIRAVPCRAVPCLVRHGDAPHALCPNNGMAFAFTVLTRRMQVQALLWPASFRYALAWRTPGARTRGASCKQRSFQPSIPGSGFGVIGSLGGL